MRRSIVTGLVAALPLCSLSLAPLPAQAQHYRAAMTAPVIQGFNVDEVRQLNPGVELPFTLYGSAGGIATLQIQGANRNLTMVETEPGRYEGTYIIGSRDHITPSSSVTANLRVGNQVTTNLLSEALVQRDVVPASGAVVAGAPRITVFDVDAGSDLTPGNDLVFTVAGTAGARVRMRIEGVRGVFFLPEVRPGEYRGTYTIRRGDAIRADSTVTADLREGGRVASATLGKPLLASAAGAAPRVTARYCTNCAVVEAVGLVNVSGDGSYIGAVAGSIVGGLLGNQVGSGNGRTAATVAGAAAGAAAGREIERARSAARKYEVTVRYDNGATQTLTYDNDPGFRVGEHVRVNDGLLVHDAR